MIRLFQGYASFIRSKLAFVPESDDRDLRYWQDRLFCSFLIYCLPVIWIALVPGVLIAVKDNMPLIALVDLLCFGLFMLTAFLPHIPLRYRKICIITIFYILAIFLINTLGYLGPGVFYLFFISVLVALIFPARYAYLSVISNVALLTLFALIISLRLFHSALIDEYSTGKWIAFSASLVFTSIIIVLLIDKIFQGLQLTITNKTQFEERYRQIFLKSPLPMWLSDTDTNNFLDVNEAAERHYGYKKEEFLAMTMLDIQWAENRPQSELWTEKRSQRYFSGISQHLKKSGELIHVNVESNFLSLEARQVRLVLATDITTQVEHQLQVFDANRKIKESESNLRALFNSALDGFVLLDANCIVKLFNPKASASMKFNKDQSPFEIGRSIFEYVEVSRLAYFREVIDKVFRGETVEYDRMFRTDGTISWIRYTITPVNEDERVVGACITGSDVTVRKLYIQSIEEQNRTFREISWLQSHVVRLPVANILGLLPLLLNAESEAERIEIINYLQLSATELDNIIHQITEKSSKTVEKYDSSS